MEKMRSRNCSAAIFCMVNILFGLNFLACSKCISVGTNYKISFLTKAVNVCNVKQH